MFPINIKQNNMNAKRKIKAVQDFAMFANLDSEQLTVKLVEAGYDEEKEVPEIISELKSESVQTKKFNLQELFETEEEDGGLVYKECEAFKEYQKELSKIDASKQINFIKVNAVGCFRQILNSKAVAVPRLVGLKMNKDKVLHKTRIDKQTAERLNSQIWNTNNLPECSIYYLVESLINY